MCGPYDASQRSPVLETGTIGRREFWYPHHSYVSMKSGLRDRNNTDIDIDIHDYFYVSMKSGLRDRNNSGVYTNGPRCTRKSQ